MINQQLLGASKERIAFKKALKRDLKLVNKYTPGVMAYINDLLVWINKRHIRYNKKRGQLGK